MTPRAYAALVALALGIGITSPAAAQRRPSIAVMPTQYFSATEEGADNVTEGLVEQFRGQGYSVMDMDRARSTFENLNMNRSTHYADRMALRFGRSIGADLVAYPRLLAVGPPAATAEPGSFLEPQAVLHLRVLNVHTGQAIYFRQIGHEFRTPADVASASGEFNLPAPVATAAANEVTDMYFQRVAGSRQEFRRTR